MFAERFGRWIHTLVSPQVLEQCVISNTEETLKEIFVEQFIAWDTKPPFREQSIYSRIVGPLPMAVGWAEGVVGMCPAEHTEVSVFLDKVLPLAFSSALLLACMWSTE